MLKEILVNENISVTDEQMNKLEEFKRLVLEKNKVMNLTGITDSDEFDLKHYLDSLILEKFVDLEKVTSILDIGTGAGFPGIPLKIVHPKIEFLLLDSLRKRIHFIEDAIRVLGLEKITAIHDRAEILANQKKYREQFDLVVSRAVARLNTLVEWSLPFVQVGGQFVAMKGKDGLEELEEAIKGIELLGGEVSEAIEYKLGDTDQNRTIIIIKKLKNTPKKYPRGGGQPQNNPL